MAVQTNMLSASWRKNNVTYYQTEVLETWVLVSWRLETRFYKSWYRSWSWTSEFSSWSWNPRVSVSVLGLGTMMTRSSSLMKRKYERQNRESYVKVQRYNVPLLEKVFCLPATSAHEEWIFSHSGLLTWANRARMGDNMLSQLVYLRCNNKL